MKYYLCNHNSAAQWQRRHLRHEGGTLGWTDCGSQCPGRRNSGCPENSDGRSQCSGARASRTPQRQRLISNSRSLSPFSECSYILQRTTVGFAAAFTSLFSRLSPCSIVRL